MPLYEVSIITRSLSKADLVKALVRAGNTLLDKGAVIESVESLGHRDLPYKRLAKQTRDPVYTSNGFLFRAHMAPDVRSITKSVFVNDLDTVHVEIVPCREKEKLAECNLEEILKPPALRTAVAALRENQKMGHFTRQMLYKRTEKEWKSVPKSYTIAPPRP